MFSSFVGFKTDGGYEQNDRTIDLEFHHHGKTSITSLDLASKLCCRTFDAMTVIIPYRI